MRRSRGRSSRHSGSPERELCDVASRVRLPSMMGIWPPDPPLSDGTVTLRPSLPRDLRAIDEGIHDVNVIRWLGPPEGSPAEVLALNERRWASGSPTLSICDTEGNCVGLVWVNVPDADRTTGSVGYWLLPRARGRGAAT